jgi:hypothetical protein
MRLNGSGARIDRRKAGSDLNFFKLDVAGHHDKRLAPVRCHLPHHIQTRIRDVD